MKLTVLLLLAAALQAQTERFGVDPRVELMSIIFHLAGNNEYTQCRIPTYNAAIDTYFAPYKDHDVVQLARELHKKDGVSFDAVMSMAVHVKDVETLAERVPFDHSSSLEQRWHGAKARRFLELARRFVADSKFTEFLKQQQPLYDFTNTRLRAFIEKNADLPWFDRFFGARAHAPFIVIPGLVNGGPSYAAHVEIDGGEEIYAIPGVWKVDRDGRPDFDASWTATLVHEISHSYVGPLIRQFRSQLEAPGDRLYKATKPEMNRQAYGGGDSVLNESLTRASAARYAFEHQGAEAGAAAVADERRRSFLWTGELVAALGRYAGDREHYPTMASFMPQIVACFKEAASRVDNMIAEYDESRPKVVSMTIANGDRAVDPELKEIVITFDRPMDTRHYAVARMGSLETPKIDKVSFDESGRVCTVAVSMAPNQDYAYTLNWPGGGSFQSKEGILLKPVEVKFHTR